ncbi:hypothetical protein HD806DRAFT_549306 [Xylariaceae sp. AK1471]|nr:hypothetical protein HD806DRAFT_549306 [Xylariaceae sp. AK1471]
MAGRPSPAFPQRYRMVPSAQESDYYFISIPNTPCRISEIMLWGYFIQNNIKPVTVQMESTWGWICVSGKADYGKVCALVKEGSFIVTKRGSENKYILHAECTNETQPAYIRMPKSFHQRTKELLSFLRLQNPIQNADHQHPQQANPTAPPTSGSSQPTTTQDEGDANAFKENHSAGNIPVSAFSHAVGIQTSFRSASNMPALGSYRSAGTQARFHSHHTAQLQLCTTSSSQYRGGSLASTSAHTTAYPTADTQPPTFKFNPNAQTFTNSGKQVSNAPSSYYDASESYPSTSASQINGNEAQQPHSHNLIARGSYDSNGYPEWEAERDEISRQENPTEIVNGSFPPEVWAETEAYIAKKQQEETLTLLAGTSPEPQLHYRASNREWRSRSV